MITNDEQIKFDEMAKRFGWTADVYGEVLDFVNEAAREAFSNGAEAAEYCHAINRKI